MSERPTDADPPRASSPAHPRRPRRRAFYSIGEVCQMFDLKPHVLRYWETQFEQLRPTKNRAGARVYQEREVETIALIRRLVHEERYTTEGARKRMEEMREEGTLTDHSGRSLQSAFLGSLESELASLLELLDPSG